MGLGQSNIKYVPVRSEHPNQHLYVGPNNINSQDLKQRIDLLTNIYSGRVGREIQVYPISGIYDHSNDNLCNAIDEKFLVLVFSNPENKKYGENFKKTFGVDWKNLFPAIKNSIIRQRIWDLGKIYKISGIFMNDRQFLRFMNSGGDLVSTLNNVLTNKLNSIKNSFNSAVREKCPGYNFDLDSREEFFPTVSVGIKEINFKNCVRNYREIRNLQNNWSQNAFSDNEIYDNFISKIGLKLANILTNLDTINNRQITGSGEVDLWKKILIIFAIVILLIIIYIYWTGGMNKYEYEH